MNITSMSRKLAAGAIAVLTAWSVHAVEYDRIDPEVSRIDFGFKQMGVGMDGRFDRFAVQLQFDPEKPESARAVLELEVDSVDTGSVEGNEEVKGKLWFDSANHPLARFESKEVKSLGDGRFELSGDLAIKGRTKPVVALVRYLPDGTRAQLEGSFAMKRSDFGVGEGEWADYGLVANEIEVRFKIQALAAGQ
ncbi:MAG: YceI family protein [Zoogloeaceae bacterium]|nr:YceI family protein [Zoogloeaceae bacterium]